MSRKRLFSLPPVAHFPLPPLSPMMTTMPWSLMRNCRHQGCRQAPAVGHLPATAVTQLRLVPHWTSSPLPLFAPPHPLMLRYSKICEQDVKTWSCGTNNLTQAIYQAYHCRLICHGNLQYCIGVSRFILYAIVGHSLFIMTVIVACVYVWSVVILWCWCDVWLQVWVGAGTRVLVPVELPAGVSLHWKFISEPKVIWLAVAILNQP